VVKMRNEKVEKQCRNPPRERNAVQKNERQKTERSDPGANAQNGAVALQ